MKNSLVVIVAALALVVCLTPAALAASTTDCTEACGHEAAIGSTHFDTLEEAIEAADNGNTITLCDDITVELTEGQNYCLLINKGITLDGDNHKLTFSGAYNSRVINVETTGTVEVKDLIVETTGERVFNVINQPATLKLDGVTATAGNYVVMVATSADGVTLDVDDCDLTGKSVINVAGPNAQVTVDDTKLTVNDQSENETYAALFLFNSATNSTITAANVTFDINGDSLKAANSAPNGSILIGGSTADVENHCAIIRYDGYAYSSATLKTAVDYVAEKDPDATIVLIRDVVLSESITIPENATLDLNGKTISAAEGYFLTVSGKTYTVTGPKAKVGTTSYATLAEAISAANEGDTITLLESVELSESLVIPAGKIVTLDLAGQTISQSKEQTEGYSMIENNGTLTIEDSLGGGKISYTDSGTGGEYVSNTITNRGTLTLKSGIVENLSSATVAQNGYPYAIDTSIWGELPEVNTVIEGGKVYGKNYSAMRLRGDSTTEAVNITVTGGEIVGTIEVQNAPSNVAATGKLTISGGVLSNSGTANVLYFFGFCDTTAIQAKITGGTFTGNIKMSESYPIGNGFNSKFISGGTFSTAISTYVVSPYKAASYSVDAKEIYAIVPDTAVAYNLSTEKAYDTLAEAIEKVANGECIVLLADNDESITVGRTVSFTIDSNGKNFTDNIAAGSYTTKNVEDGIYSFVYNYVAPVVRPTTPVEPEPAPAPEVPSVDTSAPTVSTETKENEDGSTTTTETKEDGVVVESTTGADGSKTETATKTETKETESGITTTTTSTTTTTDASGNTVKENREEVKVETDTTTTTTTTTVTESTGKTEKKEEVTETVKNEDGTETTTTTTTTETKLDNGTTATTTVDSEGAITAEVSVSSAAINEAATSKEAVTLPVSDVTAAISSEDAATISVSLPTSVGAVKVEIPVEDVSAGAVAVIVHADGTEEIVKTSVATESGVALTLGGDVTIKIIDNAQDFIDVSEGSVFAKDIDFVSSRELFNGTTSSTFEPSEEISGGQLMTALARLDGADTSTNPIQSGMDWAANAGISTGIDTGDSITRQQLVTALWRYAGCPETDYALTGSDVDAIADDAAMAMAWAIENGIVTGYSDGSVKPEQKASRAHAAAMISRYVKTIA